MAAVIKSTSYDQMEILDNIIGLHLDAPTFDVDLTYGNGRFYSGGIPMPLHRFDIDDTLDNLTESRSSSDTGLPDNTTTSCIFDPPFLTYVRRNRTGNSSMVMARRFSGYWSLDELEEHYERTIMEASRILQHKGVMVIKCQDIIHNHRLIPIHVSCINWAVKHGFRMKDMFIQIAKHRMPMSNRRGTQKHARVFHCFWLVLQRWRK